jgi:hypothetical protein
MSVKTTTICLKQLIIPKLLVPESVTARESPPLATIMKRKSLRIRNLDLRLPSPIEIITR